VTVYSDRPRLVGLARYIITDDHDCVQRVAFGRPIPAVNKNPAAKCDKLTITPYFRIDCPCSGNSKRLLCGLPCRDWASGVGRIFSQAQGARRGRVHEIRQKLIT